MHTRYDRFMLENSCSKDDVIPYTVSNFCVQFLNDLVLYMHGNRDSWDSHNREPLYTCFTVNTTAKLILVRQMV